MNPMSGRGTRSKPVWRLLILRPPQRPREAESRKADTSNQRWRCSLKELRLGAARPNVINVQTGRLRRLQVRPRSGAELWRGSRGKS